MFRFAFCVSLFLYQTLTLGSQEPWLEEIDGSKFLRGLEKQEQGEEEGLLSINEDSNSVTTPAPVAPSINTSMICRLAGHSSGIILKKWNGTTLAGFTAYRFCRPYPTIVQLRSLPGTVLFPSHIELHRCMGACYSDFRNCTVGEQEEIIINAKDVSHPSQTEDRDIIVYNHTKCDCDCINRKTDCNEAIHTFEPSSCKCNCKNDTSKTCNQAQYWDEKECKCKCKGPSPCPGKNKEWNPDICACDCKKTVKDRCIHKGKDLNTAKCMCECPLSSRNCTVGTSFLKYNCTCV